MTAERKPRRVLARGLQIVGVALVLVAALLGIWSLTHAGRGASSTEKSRVSGPQGVTTVPPSTQAAGGPTTSTSLPAGMRIVIPKIGVNAPVRALGLNADGSLQVPTDFSTVGWWSGGAYPGDLGPAVYDGHVSSTSGPAVFARLDELAPGDRIEISSPTGGLVTFKVTSSQQVAKSSFPTAAVYGWTPDPQIRLITCGGQFNTSTGHFYDNLIVYGVLSSR